ALAKGIGGADLEQPAFQLFIGHHLAIGLIEQQGSQRMNRLERGADDRVAGQGPTPATAEMTAVCGFQADPRYPIDGFMKTRVVARRKDAPPAPPSQAARTGST